MQDVRGMTTPSSRDREAPLGKGACRPLCNPLPVAAEEAIETSRRFIPANSQRRLITFTGGTSKALEPQCAIGPYRQPIT